jgi:hypothetical protein
MMVAMDRPTTVERLSELRDLCASGMARYVRISHRATLQEMADSVVERLQATTDARRSVAKTTIMRWELGTVRPSGQPALAYLDVLHDLMDLMEQTKAPRRAYRQAGRAVPSSAA